MRKAGGDVGRGMESKNGEVHRGSMCHLNLFVQ